MNMERLPRRLQHFFLLLTDDVRDVDQYQLPYLSGSLQRHFRADQAARVEAEDINRGIRRQAFDQRQHGAGIGGDIRFGCRG